MPWSRFSHDKPWFGFVLSLTRDLPVKNKVAFTSRGYELAEVATAIRQIVDDSEWSVRAIDLEIPWDSTSNRYEFERVSLPKDLHLHWQATARAQKLHQIKLSLIEEIDLTTAENLVRDSLAEADVLYRILGNSAESAAESLLDNFRNFVSIAMAGDKWWTYDAAEFGEGNGIALVRSDDVVEYIELGSEW